MPLQRSQSLGVLEQSEGAVGADRSVWQTARSIAAYTLSTDSMQPEVEMFSNRPAGIRAKAATILPELLKLPTR